MTISTTEFETDLVDLSSFGLQEVMALRDPLLVHSLDSLVRRIGEGAAAQSAGGGQDSPYFAQDCAQDRP